MADHKICRRPLPIDGPALEADALRKGMTTAELLRWYVEEESVRCLRICQQIIQDRQRSLVEKAVAETIYDRIEKW